MLKYRKFSIFLIYLMAVKIKISAKRCEAPKKIVKTCRSISLK